jgi:D-alanyl-D-alanine carboxypeptidase
MSIDETFAHLCHAALERTPCAPGVIAAVDCPAKRIAWQGGASRGEALSEAFAETPFRIASITKPFVAASIHRLAELRHLAITDPIIAMIAPETVASLREGGYRPEAIRFTHLLSHTSGLPDHTATPSYVAAIANTPQRRWTRREQIALATREGQPHGEPGEVYAYSDTGYIILGEVLERATGSSLSGAVRELVGFARLNLRGTWWELLEPAPRGVPAPASLDYAGGEGMAYDPSFDLFGGGGLMSTVGDCNRFMRALASGEVLGCRTLAGALATPLAARAAGSADWRTHSHLLASMAVGPHWALGHTGYWASACAFLPDLDAAITVTLNSGDRAAFAETRALVAGLAEALTHHTGEQA